MRPARRPVSGPLFQVLKGVEASDLPDNAKETLQDMVWTSLGVPEQKRDKYQREVVEIIGEVFERREKQLRAEMEAVTAQLKEGKTRQEDIARSVDDIILKMESVAMTVQARKCELADVARAYKAARTRTAAIEARWQNTELVLQNASKKKELLETLLRDALGPNDEISAEDIIKRIAICEISEISEDIMESLPRVLIKPLADRGPFDATVLKSVQVEVFKLINRADEAMQNAQRELQAEMPETLQEAKSKLEEVADRQVRCAKSYEEAFDKHQVWENELKKIQQETLSFQQAEKDCIGGKSKAEEAYARFLAGPKRAFLSLLTGSEVELAQALTGQILDGTPDRETLGEHVALPGKGHVVGPHAFN